MAFWRGANLPESLNWSIINLFKIHKSLQFIIIGVEIFTKIIFLVFIFWSLRSFSGHTASDAGPAHKEADSMPDSTRQTATPISSSSTDKAATGDVAGDAEKKRPA